jgi:predicted ATPase/class 3 adenylate cyclase
VDCPGCGVETQDGFRFCPSCGQRLYFHCQSCGAKLDASLAACPSCGIPAGDPASGSSASASPALTKVTDSIESPGISPPTQTLDTDSERRTVTVVFADVSGFTRLSETLDPEEVAALVDRCLTDLAEIVDQFEGTVDKFIGDCVMALFGAPIAHEDDPERAIQAALQMCAHVAGLSVHGDAAVSLESGGPSLSLHVGINTGTVVAGSIGGERRRDYTVLGDAVNVAARLGEVAGAGQVVVGESTYQLAQQAFEMEPLGRQRLRGRMEELHAYRVVRPRTTGDLVVPVSASAAPPLVGREGEIQELLTAFERAMAGRAQLVHVVGEGGIGKSRLVQDFADQISMRSPGASVSVRRTACEPRAQQTFGLTAGLFRDAYGVAPNDAPDVIRSKVRAGVGTLDIDAEEAERLSAMVEHVLGIDIAERLLPELEPEQLQRQLFLAVLRIVLGRLDQGPLVLIAEDVHWADSASLEILRRLLDRMSGRRFVLVLTSRPDFHASEVLQSSASVDITVLSVRPLERGDTMTLVSGRLGVEKSSLPDELTPLVVNRSGGNPLFILEIVRELLESGALICDPAGTRCDFGALVPDVPLSLQGLVLARLDRLPSAARRILQIASVLGPTFRDDVVTRIAPERADITSQLQFLCVSGILTADDGILSSGREGGTRLRFTQGLTQEVAYGSLLRRRRAELHGRAGLALESIVGDHPERLEDVETLAYHFSLSALKLKGARYLVMAGDWARDSYANEDAVRHYRGALDALNACEECDLQEVERERPPVEERLGRALQLVGRSEEAVARYRSALSAYERRCQRVDQARLLRRISGVAWEAGKPDEAIGLIRRGIEVLESGPEDIEQAHLYQELGRRAFRAGDNVEAIDWSRRALNLAHRLITKPTQQRSAAGAIAEAHNTLGVAMARAARSAEAIEELEAALGIAIEHSLWRAACRAYCNLGVVYATTDADRAVTLSIAGLDLARKIGHLGLQAWLHANLAGAYCTFMGNCDDDGVSAAVTAIELDRQLGQLDHLPVPLIVLGQICQCAGKSDQARRHYQEALKLAEAVQDPQLLFPCYEGLATLYLEAHDEQRATEYLDRAQELCDRFELDPDSLVVLPFLG